MASCLARHIICIQSPHTSSCAKCEVLYRYPCCAAQIRSLPKLSSRKNPEASLKSPPGEPEETSSPKRIRSRVTDISSRSSFFGSSSSLRWLRDGVFKFDPLVFDILTIAFPAALALAADPITSLVDTAFVGHLGSVELAAVGVSISVFNLVSKLFNVPLLNITTSFVAEENALICKDNDIPTVLQGKKKLPSVTTSLALATGLGIAEAVVLFFGSGNLMNIMGIPAVCQF